MLVRCYSYILWVFVGYSVFVVFAGFGLGVVCWVVGAGCGVCRYVCGFGFVKCLSLILWFAGMVRTCWLVRFDFCGCVCCVLW